MDRRSWVISDGGAMDRVAVFCAALLGVCATIMLVVAVYRGIWAGVALWVVVLAGSAGMAVVARRHLRSLSPDDD